jgi:hypothetical protein
VTAPEIGLQAPLAVTFTGLAGGGRGCSQFTHDVQPLSTQDVAGDTYAEVPHDEATLARV